MQNLKKTVLLLTAVLLLFVFTGCNKGSSLSFTEGTYSSMQPGKNGPVEVSVSFSRDKIKSVQIGKHSETPEISDTPIKRIPEEIVKNQSLAVDAVAGASMTSNAILSAVEDCVVQAGGDPAALKNAAQEESKIVKTEELSCDIAVVGAGAAGLSAAISASERGAKVIVIEKGANAGVSNGANAGGPIGVGTKTQKAAGVDLTVEELYSHMSDYANNTVNDSLLKKVISVTGETIDMMADLGMSVFLRPDSYGIGFKARHGFKERGVARAQFFVDKIESNGGALLFETAGDSLIQDADGRVTGVNAVKPNGDRVIINAKAVLLSTGGYLGSEEIIHEKFGNINIIPLGNTLSVGDGVRMAVEAGGREDRNWGIVANEFSAANSKADPWSFGCNQNLRFGIYGGLLVNMDGNRFFNEESMAANPLSGAEATLRQQKYYAVMDSSYYESVGENGIFKTLGSPAEWEAGVRNLSDTAPDSPAHVKVLDKAAGQLQEAIDQGWAFKAETIEELAEHFGLTNLPATIDNYNVLCSEGKDTDFYKNSAFMTPVVNAPFYVFEYEPSAWCTLGGIVVNDSLQVIDESSKPISGLYAAGLDAGSMYTSPYYDNEGAAFGLALGSGTLVGRIMAEDIGK